MNNKGFTLVEILIAVTILGVISLIATVSIIGVKNKFNSSYYKIISDNISLAAKDYGTDHRNSIPKDGIKVDITTFIQKGYLTSVKDIEKEDCSGYVIIKKNGLKFETDVCLICNNYKSEACK